MIGVAVKMSGGNPFLLAEDLIGIYRKCEETKGKFAVSLGNLQIDKKRASYLDCVLLLFNDKKGGRRGLLCKLDSFSIEKELSTPDSMVSYTSELNSSSKVWFLLTDSKEVGEEYFSKCELVYEEGLLSEKLSKARGGRFSRAYFKEVC